jgi:hypothetical protein
MKTAIAILLGVASAVSIDQRSSGIEYEALHEGSHWRKAWPEGIDDSTGDSEVMDMLAVKEVKPEVIPHVWYTFEPHTISMENENEDLFR